MTYPSKYIFALFALYSTTRGYQRGEVRNQTFDYVVVGGGTAGIPVATRLAAAGYSVAIVEAGGFYEDSEPILSTTPGFDFQPNPTNDWDFQTEPQAGLNNRVIPYPRGKCVGGTSGRNAMIYQKGPFGAFQKWADEVGDQSYTLPKLDRYFRKSIHFISPDASKRATNATPGYDSSALKGANGPLPVTYANFAVSFSSWVRRAMATVGIKDAGDFDNGKILGSQYFKLTISSPQQQRASSESSYLSAFKDLPNLTLYTHTLGKKILFDDQQNAIGVVAENTNMPFTLKATNEVILSAGAFQSPQLLLVSGIGPKATLEAHKIPILHENPNVGQNMVDHVWFGPAVRVKLETNSRWNDDPDYRLSVYGAFHKDREGPLTSNGGDFGAFEKVPDDLRENFTKAALKDLAAYPDDYPEIEYVVAPTFLGDFRSPQPADGYQYASIAAALMAPISRGNVTIRSADTRDAPIINPNVFTSPTDQQVAVAAYKRMRQILASPEVAPILVGDEYFPGKDVQTDEELLAHLKDAASVYYHAGSTCLMGNERGEGSKAVVDSRGKVHGVKRLRVIDASIMPFLVPSHIQSVIYAVAEKLADSIIEDATRKQHKVFFQQELKK